MGKAPELKSGALDRYEEIGLMAKTIASNDGGRKNQWFRFYNEALDDPKVQRLPAHLFKTWVNLLCLASQCDGNLPSVDDIAFRLRMSVQDADQHLSDLVMVGLIDIAKDGRSPHNWSRRQFVSDCSTERVRKHRKRKAETECNVSETASETAPEQSRAETDQIRTDQTGAQASDRPPDDLNFSDCKQAFNGSTEAMLVEVMAAMQPYGDRKGAASWLATTMRTNGSDATAQAFQMLANAKAEGQVISRVLPWWSKTAATLKASGLKAKLPPVEIRPKKSRDEAEREAKAFFDKSTERALEGYV